MVPALNFLIDRGLKEDASGADYPGTTGKEVRPGWAGMVASPGSAARRAWLWCANLLVPALAWLCYSLPSRNRGGRKQSALPQWWLQVFFWLCADCALPVAGGSQADDWASGARGAAAGKAKQFCRQKCATGCTPGRACSRLACGAYPVPLICMCCTASIICQYVNPFPWCGAARAALEGLEKLAPSACVF